MPKFSLTSRLLVAAVCLLIVIQLAQHGTYNYRHIPLDEIHNHLYKEISSNLALKKSHHDCKYEAILTSDKSRKSWDIPKTFDDFSAVGLANGTFTPAVCNPLFSIAVIVTNRNRQKQLEVFLPYMHNFLTKQNIHYKIYIVEQQDEEPWNKGILYNIGAKQAIADKFPCLILHDVDLLPLDESNLYVCTTQPRHMSASIDKFRFVLPYDFLVGGALAIRSDQYAALNGFSNRFHGWGGEDDDFAGRITSHGLEIVRFPRVMSRYTMMLHRPEPKNSDRLRIMAENKLNQLHDGLDSAWYRSVDVKPQRLFTLIGVKL